MTDFFLLQTYGREVKSTTDMKVYQGSLSREVEGFDRPVRMVFEVTKIDRIVKSKFLDGAVKSLRSRLARFRRMQRTYLYVKFWGIARNADIGLPRKPKVGIGF